VNQVTLKPKTLRESPATARDWQARLRWRDPPAGRENAAELPVAAPAAGEMPKSGWNNSRAGNLDLCALSAGTSTLARASAQPFVPTPAASAARKIHTKATRVGDHVTPAIGNFELSSPEPTNDQSLSSRREETANTTTPDDVLAERATGLRRLRTLWPAGWLVLTGIATIGWLIGMGWAAVELIRWLSG
jgi:hypothetical protein